MKAYQVDGDGTRIYFENPDNVSPEEIFGSLKEYLTGLGVEIGKSRNISFGDVYPCRYGSHCFDVFQDADDGPVIYARDQEAIEAVLELLG